MAVTWGRIEGFHHGLGNVGVSQAAWIVREALRNVGDCRLPKHLCGEAAPEDCKNIATRQRHADGQTGRNALDETPADDKWHGLLRRTEEEATPTGGHGSLEYGSATTRGIHQWSAVGPRRMLRCAEECPEHESRALKREQHGHRTKSGHPGHPDERLRGGHRDLGG